MDEQINKSSINIKNPKKFLEIYNRGCIHPIEKSGCNKSEEENKIFLEKIRKKKI